MQQLTLLSVSPDNFQLQVRRSSRAKRLRISISPAGLLEVVAPQSLASHVIQKFIWEQKSWIAKRQQYIRSFRSIELDAVLPQSVSLPSIGVKWKIDCKQGQENTIAEKTVTDKNHVTKQPSLCLTIKSEKQISELLLRWLTLKAKQVLVPWLQQISTETKLNYSASSVRGQKTRWASCSAKKNISLNRCMLFLEPDQVRYLLIHELCHTRQMNHSREFWRLVEKFAPDYVRQDELVNQACLKLPKWALM